jgi:hypothetical protein
VGEKILAIRVQEKILAIHATPVESRVRRNVSVGEGFKPLPLSDIWKCLK